MTVILPIPNSIAALHPQLTTWRQDFHAHPELGYQEHRTARTIAELLRSFGVNEVHEGIGGTGVVGVLHGQDGPAAVENRAILLRADMDALPITEKNDLPYASTHPGIMHACGHDGHTTMLLGAAKHLAETRNFSGTVLFCFQPAEEGGAGAKAMIDDGLFTRFPCHAVFGMHNWPNVEVGKLGSRHGALLAATKEFSITLTGVGGHAAMPHLTRDPIIAGCTLVDGFQKIISRRLNPVEPGVISVTQFHGGTTYNVIPETVELEGTVRCFDLDVQKMIIGDMQQMIDALLPSFGVTGELNLYKNGYPPTINDPETTDKALDVARALVGIENVIFPTPQTLGGEDFAYMSLEKPGCFMLIGNGPGPALHDPYFNFNDEILPLGTAYWVRLTETLLPREA